MSICQCKVDAKGSIAPGSPASPAEVDNMHPSGRVDAGRLNLVNYFTLNLSKHQPQRCYVQQSKSKSGRMKGEKGLGLHCNNLPKVRDEADSAEGRPANNSSKSRRLEVIKIPAVKPTPGPPGE
ncbi:hypothetical protein B0H14DRAFT_2589894 [Mycena olivaceomarginata]|nr:hypothetical protein B0H14DRAFT_2589894 [Mycena olivaceomarginata]